MKQKITRRNSQGGISAILPASLYTQAEFRARHPGIPWIDMIGMRNRLTHAYFSINLDVIWDTVTNNLAPLVEQW